jgi:hypothetical protein
MYPNATFGEMGKILSTVWHNLSDTDKSYYVKLSSESKR